MDDVLAFAQEIGVFLFLAEALCLARLVFQFADVVFEVLDVQAQGCHLLALLLDAFVASADAFPEGQGGKQLLASAFQHEGAFLKHQSVLTLDV